MWPFKDKNKELSENVERYLSKKLGLMYPCNFTDCFFYSTATLHDVKMSLLKSNALICLTCADYKRDKENYITTAEVSSNA